MLLMDNVIADELGPTCSRGLPLLHAISGCDTVSALSGISLKTALNVWQ